MNLTNRVMKKVALFLLLGMTASSSVTTLSAHAALAECAYCHIEVAPADLVTMTHAGKTHNYKCVYCAFDQAQGDYSKGDVVVKAPSEKKGKPIVIRRTNGKWTAPAGATFVGPAKLRHPICNVQYRAFTSRAAAQAYIAKNKKTLGDVQPLSMTQVLKLAS